MNKKLPITIYSSGSHLAKPAEFLRGMAEDLKSSRELAWRLAVRDISAQYRQSLLGILWALIIPLANTAVWLFLRAAQVVKVGDTGIPYPVNVFSGTILWSVFIDALNALPQQVGAIQSFPKYGPQNRS